MFLLINILLMFTLGLKYLDHLQFEYFVAVVPCHVTFEMSLFMNVKYFSGIQLEAIVIVSVNDSNRSVYLDL